MSYLTKKEVPFFNYPHVFKSNEEEFVRVFKEVGNRGAFIMQNDLVDFEKMLAEFTGAKYAIGVANGTDALIIALRAAGIGQGDEVIFCSHTMVATTAAIALVGAIPIPVEAGSDHLIDPVSIEKAITSKTKAIMPTQLNGRTCNMDALQTIADRYKLIIIEDAAQALGSKFKGKCAGTFGKAGSISFYPAKVLGCLGDGGAILTNDDEIYEKVLLLRDHGRNHDGEVVLWGYNSRLDNLQAAFLNFQFKNYPNVMARRREIASLYQEGLKDLSQVKLAPAPNLGDDHYDIYQNYEIEAEKRDDLKVWLKENGVGTLIQWGGKAVHQFPALGFKQHLPYTESLFEKMLMLPINMSMTDDDIHYVIETIKTFYANSSR